MALLRGELHANQGNIDYPSKWRVAHVAQETPPLKRSALDYAIDGDTHLRELEAQLAKLEKEEQTYENGIQLGEIHSALADADAYTVRSRAEKLLYGLGFSQEQMQQEVAHFSGGWRMRLNLAQALICPSDLLLLDEPTNHLDLDAIIWLENWLKQYKGTLIIISHDRDFLDQVVEVIVHLDECKTKRYSGNYSSFERQRAAQLVLAQNAIEKQARQRAHLESFINRFKAQATKARQAQSRIKALERMTELAPLRAAASFSFEFREPLNAPNPLLVMEEVNAGYKLDDEHETIIVNRINFSLQIGQRIGLLGVNGAGKSTFIKTIAQEIQPLSGTITVGKGLVIGYFAQHQVEMLRHDESPLWHLKKIAPLVREQELRNFLGSFNFAGDMATNSIAPFSGGEKARLALALIVWQRPNLLLLDEPTNHLDLETREALTDALSQFEGTLIVVSHDRHLLRATTDQFFIVSQNKLTPFDGDLDDYKKWLLENKFKEESAKPQKTKITPLVINAEQKQKAQQLKKSIEKQINQLETKIAQLNEQKSKIEEALSSSEIYDVNNKSKLDRLLTEQTTCQQQLEQHEENWLTQQQALEEINLTLS
jgi:ATP-binding cassette subfamily F protein 3